MLDMAEKLRKSLNPKKPKRTREPRASDTDAPRNAMAQTFAEYIQYLKAEAAPTPALSLPVTPTATPSTNSLIPRDAMGEIRDMLRQLTNAVGLRSENPSAQ